MTLSEIRQHLARLGVRPSRRLGQNFLHDQNLARRLVELAEINQNESVLEIGPGLGALTEHLVQRNVPLTLIEKDRRLAGFLRDRFPCVRVVEGDALEKILDFGFRISDFVVIGNLPYSIASPLIVRLCESGLRPARMLFTVQREVAERLTAAPRTRDYGMLTLLTRSFYEIAIARRLPPSVFWPVPEVASAVIRMTRCEKSIFPEAAIEQRFREIVKRAFQKRRKTMRAIFGRDPPFDRGAMRRPEELSIEEWSALAAAAFQESEIQNPQPKIGDELFDVVNEHDEVIGQERRSEAHRLGKWHRAVHILVWNRRRQILLQKRSSTKDLAPDTWDSSAAGHLAAGEEYDAAAVREVREELGVSPILRRVRKFEAHRDLGWEFVWLYETTAEGPFEFPRTEISEVRWWNPDEVSRAIRASPADFAPSFRHIWGRSS